MAGALRLWYENLVHAVGDPDSPTATLTASSSAAAGPVSNLLDQLRSKVWRSTGVTQASIRLDLGSARLATVAAVVGHNLTAAGTVRIQSSTTSAFSVLSTNALLVASASDDMRLAYFTADTKQHWRLLITDAANPDGFFEVGVWYVGPYVEPSIRPSINLSRERDELSAVSHAIDGANHSDSRPVRDVWSLEWLEALDADIAILEAAGNAMPPGRDFFITFDADDAANDSQYGYFVGNMQIQHVPWQYWTLTARFAEALG